jgi:hypothetical protein
MLRVLGRQVIEREQRVAIPGQALDSFVVLVAPALDETVERGAFWSGAIQISCSARFTFGRWLSAAC